MGDVAQGEVFVPDREVGKGHGEVVHHHLVAAVRLAVVEQHAELGFRLAGTAQGCQRKPLVVDLLRLGVVVVERGDGFEVPLRCLLPAGAGFVCLSGTLPGEAQIVVEILLLGAVELAFAEVLRVDEALLEQRDGVRPALFRHRLLRHLDAAALVLRRDLAFSAFPRVESVGVQLFAGFGVAAEVVQQGDLFEHEVVAALHLGAVRLQAVKALLRGAAEFLVELVQLHQDAGVGLVEGVGALHRGQGAGGVVALVVAYEREAAPGAREVRVRRDGLLPARLSQVVLTLVVPEVAEQPRRPRIARVRRRQDFNRLQAIRETDPVLLRRRSAAGRLQTRAAAERSGGAIIFPIIKRHLRERITLRAEGPKGIRLVIEAGGAEIERDLVVILALAAHQRSERLPVAGTEQQLHPAAAVVELVQRE